MPQSPIGFCPQEVGESPQRDSEERSKVPSPSSPQSPTQLVIIHVRLALPDAPEPSHLVRVLDDELP